MPSTELAKSGIRVGYSDGETGWGTEVNESLRRVDAGIMNQWAQKRSTTTGLTYGYHGGPVPTSGSLSIIADGTIALTGSATNYVEHDAAGTVTVNLSGFSVGKTPMAEIATNAGAIISVTDRRMLATQGPGTSGIFALSGNPAKLRNISGAFDVQFRNNADSATNLGITDAGAVSVRTSLAIGTDPGGAEILRVGGALRTRMLAGGANIFEGYVNQVNLLVRRANGTPASPTMILSGQILGEISFQGYNSGAVDFQYGAEILALADEDFDTTGQTGSSLYFYVAPIGGVMTSRWSMRSTGHLVPTSDNTQDVGITSTRLRTGRFGTSLVLGLASPVTVDLNGTNNLRIDNSLDLSGATPWIGSSTNTSFTLRTNNTDKWTVSADGHLLAATDASLDLGAAGATRPRDGFFSRRLQVGPVLVGGNGLEATITAAGVPAIFGVVDGSVNARLLVSITPGNPSVIAIQTDSAANSARLYLVAHGAGSEVAVQTNGATQWYVDSAGRLLSGNESQDIGQAGTARPNNIYVKGFIDIAAAVALKLAAVDFLAQDATYHIIKEKAGVDAIKLAAGTNFYQNNTHTWRTTAGADRASLVLTGAVSTQFTVGGSAWDGSAAITAETIDNASNRIAVLQAKSRLTPSLRLFETNQAANEGQWGLHVSGSDLVIATISDAGAVGNAVVTFQRSAGLVAGDIITAANIKPTIAATGSIGTDALPYGTVVTNRVVVGITGVTGGLAPAENTLSVANGGSTGTSNVRSPYTRLTLTGAAGTVTIDAPASMGSPLYLSLIINNTASGTMTLTWNAIFQTGSLPATIVSGAVIHLLFLFSDVLNRWVKVA